MSWPSLGCQESRAPVWLSMAEVLWLQDHQGSIQWKLVQFYFFLRPTQAYWWEHVGCSSAFCVLTRLAGDLRFVVIWELNWMRAKRQQKKVHWNYWISKSRELLLNVTSQVKKTSFYERWKDKNNTAACSMPEKPTGPPSLYGLVATLLSCLQMTRSMGLVFLLNPMGIAGH